MTFPFKCEADQWNEWQCVADTIFALPGERLHTFRQHCVGYHSGSAQCFRQISSHPSINRRLSPSINRTDSKHKNQKNRTDYLTDTRKLFVDKKSQQAQPSVGRGHNVKRLSGYRKPKLRDFEEKRIEYITEETATEKAKKSISLSQELSHAQKQGGDAGPFPHDGRGCYQCAMKMAKKHVVKDSVFQNSDFPGNSYECFDVENLGSSKIALEAHKLCEKSCQDERYPDFGRCMAWSMKMKSKPPYSCCLKNQISELVPTSRVISGVMATLDGGLANMKVTIVRSHEMRNTVEW
eukprot:CAMPEP_0114339180 /NCGR_PEP_ID=MMETSP0101-20121206/7558_1 /TAXON_ID=38822 ORGANISM="Pteridomonas danica, Strain PT" /NCGR_SAMPLE_ID=MMETSP0101 /ASSEMBLY_ACC=CAM_ASM_000211 /LENGTH=293 /DNA_ID=CAMNT_0001472063 /DNA_START=214 /DNA_END=1092 /DNA_ORIENTATION=+